MFLCFIRRKPTIKNPHPKPKVALITSMCLFSFTCFHHNNVALTGNGDAVERPIPYTADALQAPSQSTGSQAGTSQTHTIPPGTFGFVKPHVVVTPFWRRKKASEKNDHVTTEEPVEDSVKDEKETLLSE
ncbi:hypothetical protein F4604DRAFT_1676386 [Suillus subluteus]|nr:hypothetical protein F4604DRAFT_1676386 [Suillus subluteus]